MVAIYGMKGSHLWAFRFLGMGDRYLLMGDGVSGFGSWVAVYGKPVGFAV